MELKYKIWVALYIVGYIIAYRMVRWNERDMCRVGNKQYDLGNVVSVAVISLLSLIVPLCVLLAMLVDMLDDAIRARRRVKAEQNKDKNQNKKTSLPPKFL